MTAAAPYERAYPEAIYIRGLAYLKMRKGPEAAAHRFDRGKRIVLLVLRNCYDRILSLIDRRDGILIELLIRLLLGTLPFLFDIRAALHFRILPLLVEIRL